MQIPSIANRCPSDDPFCIDCYDEERRELYAEVDRLQKALEATKKSKRTLINRHKRLGSQHAALIRKQKD